MSFSTDSWVETVFSKPPLARARPKLLLETLTMLLPPKMGNVYSRVVIGVMSSTPSWNV